MTPDDADIDLAYLSPIWVFCVGPMITMLRRSRLPQ
jgi:hypothetical protein